MLYYMIPSSLYLCVGRPLFSHSLSPSSPTIYPWSVGGTLWVELGIATPPSLQTTCQMEPLCSFLTTLSRGSVFCCSWTALSKSLSFTPSVCAARLTKTQTAFFQPEVLVLASQTSPLPPFHAQPSPSTSSLKHQIFHFEGRVEEVREEGEKRDTVYSENNLDGCFDRVDIGCVPTGKVRSR